MVTEKHTLYDYMYMKCPEEANLKRQRVEIRGCLGLRRMRDWKGDECEI